MKFPLDRFRQFCSHLILNSKEQGRVRFKWNGAQKLFTRKMVESLEDDRHKFVVLKARQLGLTTITLALDLFWLYRNPGTQGGLAVNNEKVRDLSRAVLTNYMDSLPRNMKWPCHPNNRSEMGFKNKSRLSHLIAGGRNSGSLSRGEGLNHLHATEISSWSDEEGIISLDASLAEKNPKRLYIYESTARGYNVWHDLWEDALKSFSTEAIFIGWWAKEDYSLPRNSRLFDVYGGGGPNREERSWCNEVKRLYEHEITPEQLAWWRWKRAESGDSRLLLAEYPWTADQAFVMTGEQFFPLRILQQIMQHTEKQPRQCWHYVINKRFEETELVFDPDGALSIWEEPIDNEMYVVAADPAYGESEWADHFCIQVLKCHRTMVEQVAEFNTPDCSMYGFAWIMAHLAGAYSTRAAPATVILELGGPGRGVLQELQRMPSMYAEALPHLSKTARNSLMNLFGSIQHYLYRRPDSMTGTALLQWETSWKTKPIMMNTLRDCIERGTIVINSPEWPEEARYVTQDGSRIQAEGRHKDDRVIAMALGIMAWQDQVIPQLMSRANTEEPAANDPVARSVQKYLRGVTMQQDEKTWLEAGGEKWHD